MIDPKTGQVTFGGKTFSVTDIDYTKVNGLCQHHLEDGHRFGLAYQNLSIIETIVRLGRGEDVWHRAHPVCLKVAGRLKAAR